MGADASVDPVAPPLSGRAPLVECTIPKDGHVSLSAIIDELSALPYPLDFTSTPLKALAKALSPALFVMTGGNSNCISYDGFDSADSADPRGSSLLNFDFMKNESSYLFNAILGHIRIK